MDIHNFNLSSIFHDNAKEYVTRPVRAAKYQPGMENGWMVYFESKSENGKHYGIRFFPTKDEAQKFIEADEKQYAMEDGMLVGMEVECDAPLPVLCREESNIQNNNGVLFRFGDKAFISDESEDYEFYILDCKWCDNDTWIILDREGNIRVWDSTSEELFFGKESEYVFEKNDKGEYMQVAV